MSRRMDVRILSLLLLAAVSMLLSPSVAAESTISSSFSPLLLLPMLLAGVATYLLWKHLLPSSLSSLQVAFEVDDGLYEVHRLTKDRDDARKLLALPRVGAGVSAYLMAMAGMLIIIIELIILPDTYHWLSVFSMVVLIALPVLYSPLETLAAQLGGGTGEEQVGGSGLGRLLKRFSLLIVLVLLTAGVLSYGWNAHPQNRATWVVYAALLFMSPTILAYGRILGASWNMLLLNKWRSYNRQQTPINPEQPGLFARINSLVLVIFLATMPVTALNGIFTVIYVIFGDASPTLESNILNFGGLLGWGITEATSLQELIERFQWLKAVPVVLATFLSLNIAIVGLAFIFELIRNLFLGGQAFSGFGGVVLATPHETRSEESVQARLLYFSFAGFSGYTVLLLVLVCYKEFSSLMPYSSALEQKGFTEPVILLATWSFIAVGQAVFLITWTLSLPRMKHLREMRFDLSPEERREELIAEGAGEWMRKMIHKSAWLEDINGLRLFQSEKLAGDPAAVRMEKTRARMIERALRGLWPEAMREARSLLAQQGGKGTEARLVLATSYLATRRLDAAKQILHTIPKESRDADAEVLMMLTEYLDPWRGQACDKQIQKHSKHPAVAHLQTIMARLERWEAWDEGARTEGGMLDLKARLSSIALLRMQRRGVEALGLAVSAVKEHPEHVGARISLALCLLDGMAMPEDRFSALDLYRGLMRDAAADPRVVALGMILGDDVSAEELEPALAGGDAGLAGEWIDAAPTNPVAAMFTQDGEDEALAANMLIVGHQAIDRGLLPSLRRTEREYLLHYVMLMPLWALLGTAIGFYQGSIAPGMLTALTLIFGHVFLLRIQRSQEKHVTHRNQLAMINLARRMRRNRVAFDASDLPVGTHLLLSGLLVKVKGITYDIGMPGWLVEHLAPTTQREFIEVTNDSAFRSYEPVEPL